MKVLWQHSLPSGVTLGPADMLESSKFNVSVHCYDFLNTYKGGLNPTSSIEMPPFYKEQQHGVTAGMFAKQANQHSELGYIKSKFFDSLTIFKPSVTVMIFDW